MAYFFTIWIVCILLGTIRTIIEGHSIATVIIYFFVSIVSGGVISMIITKLFDLWPFDDSDGKNKRDNNEESDNNT